MEKMLIFEKKTMTMERDARPVYTPEYITQLRPDEVFVFGSNLAGMHGGGAAYIAWRQFGAVMGQGVGLQGQSYAIPTMQGGVETIRPYVEEFIAFAGEHPEKFFYVTRIGCGIAGFRDDEIAPLFAGALDMDNVCLPESFSRIARVCRVREMEERFDRADSEDLAVLREYMDSGRWKADFEADERGEIPSGLKRGVLSEDGLYDLLQEHNPENPC